MKLPKNLTTVTPLSKVLALALYFILMILGFLLGVQYQKGKASTPAISSYDECVSAGNPVQERSPAVCVMPDGRQFEQPME